tara:strand:+ start:1886 stop:2194 length:309 start_codon:yes stop_codon:yes gene_type:complete
MVSIVETFKGETMKISFNENLPVQSRPIITKLISEHGLAAVATKAHVIRVTNGHYATSQRIVYRDYVLVRFQYKDVLLGFGVMGIVDNKLKMIDKHPPRRPY